MSWVQNQNPKNGFSEMFWQMLEQQKTMVKWIFRVLITNFSPAARQTSCNGCVTGGVTTQTPKILFWGARGPGPQIGRGGGHLTRTQSRIAPVDAG